MLLDKAGYTKFCLSTRLETKIWNEAWFLLELFLFFFLSKYGLGECRKNGVLRKSLSQKVDDELQGNFCRVSVLVKFPFKSLSSIAM